MVWGRGAAAAVIVFDITNAESLSKAKAWVKELQRQGSPNMIMALAGNKADLGEARAVTADEAQVCLVSWPACCQAYMLTPLSAGTRPRHRKGVQLYLSFLSSLDVCRHLPWRTTSSSTRHLPRAT